MCIAIRTFFRGQKNFTGIPRLEFTTYIFMEYYEKSSLKELIRIGKSESGQERFYEWLIRISDEMKYLHSKNSVHRDLKPAKWARLTFQLLQHKSTSVEVLTFQYTFCKKRCVKNLQFWLGSGATRVRKKTVTFCGTIRYGAPEVFREDEGYF